MTKRMLIDATHAEETRVAVVDGNRLIEFDYESKVRKQLKGSIFLAKVTRVEPSLQAAFVNFGGNRHGFLPFSEIHPDYFRIPVADREALLAEQKAMLEQMAAEEERMIAEEEAALAAMERGEAPSEENTDQNNEESADDSEDEIVEEVGGDDSSYEESQEEPQSQIEENNDSGSEDESESDDADNELAEENHELSEANSEASGEEAEEPIKILREWIYRPVTSFNAETQEYETSEEGDAFKFDAETGSIVKSLVEQNEAIIRIRADAQADEDGVEHIVVWVAFRAENEEVIEEEKNNRSGRRRRGRGRFRGRGRDRGDRNGSEDRSERPERAERVNDRGGRGGDRNGRRNQKGGRHNFRSKRVELVGGDGVEGDQPFRFNLRKNYKIQEVIKRGQIMLVQVQKEERGNKGAAVTTYLSLPGRYCVLMPNSPRGGGVSRKIASFAERKRMREILKELSVPEGMSVILRTAGVQREKDEIKRDLDYLMRLWDNIRELTLQSVAPANIYEESNLVKRAVRDIFGNDIEDIQVQGEAGFKEAKNFMKMLMPSHVKKVIEYADAKIPLFHRFQVENQIAEIGETQVTLRSGGYLVINPTEALVSVDVNSGRATKERHIEETALKTNLEAADEVARQLRLRDLGGLVVIDFIDMEDHRNNSKVERRLKDALSSDRARIQVGRISSFGLLELSRQRLNPSLTEAQYEKCPHCKGVGSIRSVDSACILALRSLEEEGFKNKAEQVELTIPNAIAIYMLNHKRNVLADIERRYNFQVMIKVDDELAPTGFKVESIKAEISDSPRGARFDDEDENDYAHTRPQAAAKPVAVPSPFDDIDEEEAEIVDEQNNGNSKDYTPRGDKGDRNNKRRGNRAGKSRGGRNGRERGDRSPEDNGGSDAQPAAYVTPAHQIQPEPVAEAKPKFQAKRFSSRKAETAQPSADSVAVSPSNDTQAEAQKQDPSLNADGSKKKGWWNRLVE
ncbi:MAG: ribonuclease [Micavibrio aeruginosavorus]|uniref:Ribonuclease G n=1 Tax=Micavibrio aeruginosavorus TaxID=349221 RepID=A0A2W5FSJ3_9BACT|nr:MAG: ribonuclease [Micavibrio aeruginosavorus]